MSERGVPLAALTAVVAGAPSRVFGAQAAGCAPIVRAVRAGGDRIEPVVPDTIARSLAIGNPADGALAVRAILESGGWAAAVSDEELIDGIQRLAAYTGIFAETAGGVTVAAAGALARAGKLSPEDEVVLCVTGHGLKTVEAAEATLNAAATIPPKVGAVARLVDETAA